MVVQFKKDRWPACHDNEQLTSGGLYRPERLRGPYDSCGDCPYASHGFICHSSPNDCLRTDMEKINRRQKADRN